MKKAPTLIASAVANLKNQNLKGKKKKKGIKEFRQLLKYDLIHKDSDNTKCIHSRLGFLIHSLTQIFQDKNLFPPPENDA